MGITAQAVTWILYLAWASTKDTRDQLTTGVFFLITFFLIFTLMVASFKRRQARFTEHDTYQLVLNNLALYLGALFMSGVETFSGLTLAMITLGTSLLVALQAFVTYYYWKDEGWLARVLATLSLMLFVLFIAFQWEGITVTLLWLLTAVVIFLWGFYKASVSGRLAGVLLMGATLAKLVMMDSQVFSTLQKVIAYLVLGVLLLAVSFFYQKYRKEIFGKEKERGDDR